MKILLIAIERELWEWAPKHGYNARSAYHLRHHLTPFYRFLKTVGIVDPNYQIQPAAITKKVIGHYQTNVRETVSALTGKQLSANTQFNRMAALKILLRFLQQTGKLTVDPGAEIVMPLLPQKTPPNLLTPQEVQALLTSVDLKTRMGLRNRAMLELFWTAGLRMEELLDLQIDDINNSAVHIRNGVERKGRTVPIPKQEWLQQYCDKLRPLFTKKDSKLLFLNWRGEKILFTGFRIHFMSYRKKAGIKKLVTIHSFRHLLATEIARDNPPTLQKLLGFESLETTRRYIEIVREDLKELFTADANEVQPNKTGLPRINYQHSARPTNRFGRHQRKN